MSHDSIFPEPDTNPNNAGQNYTGPTSGTPTQPMSAQPISAQPTPAPPHSENLAGAAKTPGLPVGSMIGALILVALGIVCISIGSGLVINLMTVAIVALIAGAIALLVSAFRTS